MRDRLAMVAVVGMLLMGAGARVANAVEASFGVDVLSAYVWRGMTFNNGLVVQPNLDVTFPAGFGVNVWGNYDVDDYDGDIEGSEWSELDLTLSYEIPLPVEMLSASVGFIQYTFPMAAGDDASDTQEIFASLGLEPLDGLSVGVDVYQDVDQGRDVYVSGSVGYLLELADVLGVEVGASAGFAGQKYTADGKAGLFDYSVSVALSCAPYDWLSLALTAAYVDTLDKDRLADAFVADGIPYVDSNGYYGGSLGVTF